jgi:hypothetical protein
MYQTGGQPAAAESQWERALPVFERLAREDPADPDDRDGMVRTLRGLLSVSLGYANSGQGEKARAALAQALPAGERLAREHRGSPEYQDLLAQLRAGDACGLARLGQHRRAAGEAEAAAAGARPSAVVLYNAACAYAVCSAAARQDTGLGEGDRHRLNERYAARAVELLREAVAERYQGAAHMKEDRDLDPLRDRDDFKKLIQELDRQGR